jgi:hypothetical protein
MCVEHRIDDLIEAGWGVLESDFDPVVFQCWRRRAFNCLTAMVGPDHVYTRHFERFVRQEGEVDLLIASGILSAAKEQASCSRQQQSVKANGNLTSVSLTEQIGGSMKRRASK